MKKGRILSGIQPTGNLHLGNYLGAIAQWVPLQKEYDCFFCIVDLHALTVHQDPAQLRQWTREGAAVYIACGINSDESVIFPQSAIAAHAQLAWLLSCLTPLGWLNRMTQFKEKAGKDRENANLGLYAYPVLMAADILIYKATHVPVGDDQKQHLELVRDIAQTFNHRFGRDFFPLPNPLIMGAATRVMSLRDGTTKMSKSDPSDFSRIHLTDDDDLITAKIRKAKTDPDPIKANLEDMAQRPEALNLLSIFAALSQQPVEKIAQIYDGSTFAPFKKDLTDLLITHLSPIREKLRRLLAAPDHLERVLQKGQEKAGHLAHLHLTQIHKLMGLWKK